MTAIRAGVFSLGAMLALSATARAQVVQRVQVRPLVGPAQLGEPLVAKAIEDKLNLTADQKGKIAKIEKEFADKHKTNEIKLRDDVQKARDDKDRAALKALQEKMTEARTTREGFEKQVQAVLTEEQRKAFQRPGIAIRPGIAAAPQLLQGAFPERLKLTDEQKEKLSQLQKDFEAKALQVLTEEQRQKYEELKKGRVRPPQEQRQRQSSLESRSPAPFVPVLSAPKS